MSALLWTLTNSFEEKRDKGIKRYFLISHLNKSTSPFTPSLKFLIHQQATQDSILIFFGLTFAMKSNLDSKFIKQILRQNF